MSVNDDGLVKRTTYVKYLLATLEDVFNRVESWIVDIPQVRHDHNADIRVVRMRQYIQQWNTSVARVFAKRLRREVAIYIQFCRCRRNRLHHHQLAVRNACCIYHVTAVYLGVGVERETHGERDGDGIPEWVRDPLLQQRCHRQEAARPAPILGDSGGEGCSRSTPRTETGLSNRSRGDANGGPLLCSHSMSPYHER